MNNEPMQEAAATIHVPHVCRTWNDALDAAEAAVAELPLTGGWTTPDGVIEEVDKAKAVAVIRALKEKP